MMPDLYDILRTKKETSKPLEQKLYGRKTHFLIED